MSSPSNVSWGIMEMNVYLPLIGVSMVASGISIFTAFDRSDIRRSAVQYCTYSVFCCDFLWALFRFVLYLLGSINGKLPSPNSGNRQVTDLNEAIVIGEAIFTVAGDLFIVASSIWIALSAYEMQRVVTHTLTRPEEQERRTILTYEITIYVPLAIMLLLFSLGPVSKKDIGTATTCLMVSLYLVVWSLFLAVLYLPFSFCKIYSVRQNRAGFFDHSLEHIYRRLRILLIVYACTTIPTSVVSLAAEMNTDPHVLGPHTNSIFFATNCLFYLTGLFNAFSIGGSVLCCLRCLRPVMPRELHEELMAGGRSSYAMMTSQNSTSPPDHLPVFVCTDIEGSTLLWSRLPGPMTTAQSLHDDCMRLHLSTYNGYEITTAGDAFQLAFHTVTEAISYCMTIQLKLMDEPWPKELDDFMCAKNVTDMFGRPLFRGLRVRMAIHFGDGDIIRQIHPTTGKWTYVGLPELVAREIGDSGLGGQILISNATRDRYVKETHEWPKPAKKDKRILNHERDFFFRDAPSCSIGDLNIVVPMSEVVPYLLRSRFTNNRAKPIHLFT
ncbi:hypothetical protein Ae201684_001040 [Aphanomyces euteiches]|uniref:Guanylate cyclase domain-containing protein n=1 Tax=Aphanomyces euteiches TaxID=100861 RepID=A0A6G0XV83_9STRA|nr:hypothetical protein Ae201684_001040 [Aphanomyces euteiches]KAH9140177.1 hypothetical protein AeRB84_015560 [Aphanomyces euteiches]